MNKIKVNFISRELDEKSKNELTTLYVYYIRLSKCYLWKHIALKKRRLFLNLISLTLITIGTIVGATTDNNYVTGILSGMGIIIQGYVTKSNLNNNVAETKFAYTSFEKIIVQIEGFLRGIKYDSSVFLSDVKVLEDIVIDICPQIDKLKMRYDQLYENNVSEI